MNTVRYELKKTIMDIIPEYFKEAFPLQEFIPGESTIPVSGKVFDSSDLSALIESSLDFWLTAGSYASKFEREFAEKCGLKDAILVNSGSSANLLAFAALTSSSLEDRALRPGDEVITVAASFPTTVNPIYQYGLVPVYVDVELETYNASIEAVKEALSERTKAIFMAHILGNPFDAKSISEFAKENNLWLIEDCCDALGSELDNKKVGIFGDLATYSFYPAHHITMGEGGAVATDSLELKRLLLSFRDWGRDCQCMPGQDNRCGKRFSQKFGELPHGYDHKYVYSEIGYNMKATDMQAAVGLSQLKKLESFTAIRKRNYAYLREKLEKYSDVLLLPEATPNSTPSGVGFPMAVKPESGLLRSDLIRFLDSRKIGTRLLFCGNLTRQPAYLGKNHRIVGELANTDYVMNNVFWTGVYPGLTSEMLDYVAQSIGEFLGG